MTRTSASSGPAVLRLLLGMHAVAEPRILDCSYGHGAIWRGLPYRPVRLDVRAELPGLDLVADWRDLGSHFGPRSFDVVCWDPIHVSDVGSRSILGQRYAAGEAPVRGVNISGLFQPFLEAARGVLEADTGIVVAKLCDQVHNGRQQLAFVDFVNTARELGWTVCDYVPLLRASSIRDPKWIHQYHVRKSWSWWVVVRNGSSCVGPGRDLLRICGSCRRPFRARRQDAVTCGPACRQRRHRQAQPK